MPSILSRGNGEELFCFNYCDACLMLMSNVTSFRGNGDKIYQANKDVPKNFYINLKKRALDPDKGPKLLYRTQEAQFDVLKNSKVRYV